MKKMRAVSEVLIGKETAFESVQGTSVQAVLKRENVIDMAAERAGVHILGYSKSKRHNVRDEENIRTRLFPYQAPQILKSRVEDKSVST